MSLPPPGSMPPLLLRIITIPPSALNPVGSELGDDEAPLRDEQACKRESDEEGTSDGHDYMSAFLQLGTTLDPPSTL